MNPPLQELITQSVELLFIGMGAVFSILVLLITLITLVSRLVQRYAAEEEPSLAPRRAAPATRGDAETIAVIGAAIHAWRQKQS